MKISASGLVYREIASGAPLVLLHPTPLSHAYWLPMIGELGSAGVRYIVPDLRGHGATPLLANLPQSLPAGGFDLVPDAPVLSMEQHAHDVLNILDELGIEAAIFAGCSIGGYVLLEMWRQAPERMRGLAFVCSKPQPDAGPARAKREDTIAKVRAEGVDALFDAQSQNLVGRTTLTQSPQTAAEVRAQMKCTPEAVIATQAGLATRPDSLPTVGSISVPVLAIAGGEDVAVSPEDMEAFRNAPGGCELHLLPDAGHLAAYEQPQKVAGILQRWLKRFTA